MLYWFIPWYRLSVCLFFFVVSIRLSNWSKKIEIYAYSRCSFLFFFCVSIELLWSQLCIFVVFKQSRKCTTILKIGISLKTKPQQERKRVTQVIDIGTSVKVRPNSYEICRLWRDLFHAHAHQPSFNISKFIFANNSILSTLSNCVWSNENADVTWKFVNCQWF